MRKNRKNIAGYRKKTRELLMRIIFQMTSTGDFSDSAKEAFLSDTSLYLGNVQEETPPGCIFEESAGERPDIPYLNWAFLCVREHLSDIDRILLTASKEWSIGRMNMVDLSILRVATAEILYMDDIDDSVSINEAVIMAKKYGTEKSAAFINGILGTVTRAESRVSV